MAEQMHGHISAVGLKLRGDELTADAPASATVLTVQDVADFDDKYGGLLRLTSVTSGTTENVTYLTTDDDESTITLAAPLANSFEASDRVDVLTANGSEVPVWYADITDDLDGSPFSLPLSHDLIDKVEEGIRLVGESVVGEEDESGEWFAVDILGKRPEVDGGFLRDGSITEDKVSFTTGGITTTVDETEPTDPTEGDLWVKPSDGNLIRRSDGADWQPVPFSAGALSTNAVSADVLAANAITSKHSITGALFRTAATGQRWELASAAVNTLLSYAGVSGETPGGLTIRDSDGEPQIRLRSGYTTDSALETGVDFIGGGSSAVRANSISFVPAGTFGSNSFGVLVVQPNAGTVTINSNDTALDSLLRATGDGAAVDPNSVKVGPLVGFAGEDGVSNGRAVLRSDQGFDAVSYDGDTGALTLEDNGLAAPSGAIVSDATDTDGPLIDLNADGSGRVGPYRWDSAGELVGYDSIRLTPTMGGVAGHDFFIKRIAPGVVAVSGYLDVDDTNTSRRDTGMRIPAGMEPISELIVSAPSVGQGSSYRYFFMPADHPTSPGWIEFQQDGSNVGPYEGITAVWFTN